MFRDIIIKKYTLGAIRMTHTNATRIEKDTMGEMEVPADAYWGASTQRAVLNFPISNIRYPSDFISMLGRIKRAAANANQQLGLLDPEIAKSISAASTEVIDGHWDNHFVVDLFQTGSGTSTNTNANEVIAKRAREIADGLNIHPNDHVNMAQSSNDVIPSATHLTAAKAIKDELIPALEKAQKTLIEKSNEFWEVIKTGRTHLQDATPIRLGQEFQGYASQIELSIDRIKPHLSALSEIALGGTAVGTGINAHENFARAACEILSKELSLPVKETAHHFQAQGTQDAMVSASGAVRSIAIALQKIANDLRWLSSGPRAGLAELELPTVQPGSSIMPGKVNPVIPESVVQVVCQVLGNDAAISAASQGGYLELNTYWPVSAYNLHQSITLLASATSNFDIQCLQGIKATAKGPDMVEQGLMMATGLTPAIGYDQATTIAKTAATEGKTIREVARRETDLTDDQISDLLNPSRMTAPGIVEGASGGGG